MNRDKIADCILRFEDCLMKKPTDVTGIDPSVVVHRIPLLPGATPVKQKLRRMKPEWALKIKDEIAKQLEANFIEPIVYPKWLANVVPVPKKDGKVRMCFDYRDLNKAFPKDDFPLPHIDLLIDRMAGHEMVSLTDLAAGYNQILMHGPDKEKTSFISEWGTFCYRVMPFGLKNAGATYQRMATTVFHDMIHQEVEVYVDDMIVKSKTPEGHLEALEKFFLRLRKFNLKLNPAKCLFGETSGVFLGYLVSKRGIEVDPSKAKAILEMPPPRTESEIRGFLGRLQYISRLINQLADTCGPIFKLLRKGASKKWNEECQKAFEEIKEYLLSPPILQPPRIGKPLLLYLSVTEESMGAMLAQEAEDKKVENAVYYLSKRMLEYEMKYSRTEKLCLALFWACTKLQHYLSSYTTYVIAEMSPLKFLMERPVLDSKMAKWVAVFAAFDLKFINRKAVKGGAIADQLAELPVEDRGPEADFPDGDIVEVESETWEMYFDGASNHHGTGVGVVFKTPCGEYVPISIKLDFSHTNNEAEYEACISGLEASLDFGIKNLKVYEESILIVSQALRKWKIKEERLFPYLRRLDELAQQFENLTFEYLPRAKNQFEDALATLASMVSVPEGRPIRPLRIRLHKQPAHIMQLVEEKPWFGDIQNYLKNGEYPMGSSKNDQRTIRSLSTSYVMNGEILYKRGWNGILLRCVDEGEARQLIEMIHGGEEGSHMYGMAMSRKIADLGYYWTTMNADCVDFVRKCHQCQIFAKLQKRPPIELNPITSPWPFATWGIDVIGQVHPKASNGHQFILVAVDYFTKWVEAESFSVLTAKKVAHFVKANILCRYGTPFEIISDNGPHFQKEFVDLLKRKKVQHHKSSPYRPQTNGVVEE